MQQSGTLIFFCGKMGSGKTTKSRNIACSTGAVLLSEDEWLANLYPDEIRNFNDYLAYSARLKGVIKGHVQKLLNSGVTVVMDFPANTRSQRQWFKEIYSANDRPHKLVYIEASDQRCLQQIEQRRISNPKRAAFDTEAVFHQVTAYFEPPTQEEGFNIELIKREI